MLALNMKQHHAQEGIIAERKAEESVIKSSSGILQLDIQQSKITWQGQSIRMRRSLIPVFVHLWADEQHTVKTEQLTVLAPQCGVTPKGLRNSLYHLIRQIKKVFGDSFITPLPNKDGFGLDQKLVTTFTSLQGDHPLILTDIQQAKLMPSRQVMLNLLDAEHHFELGNYLAAQTLLEESLTLDPHPEQEVSIRCLLCWIVLRMSDDGKFVLSKTHELITWFRRFDTPHQQLSDMARARILIQQGRTYMSYQFKEKAKKVFHRANTLLPPTAWKERSTIQAGLGYIEMKHNEFAAAELYFHEALRLATLARWPWSVQVQLCNIAGLYNRKYHQILLGELEGDKVGLLEQATEFLREAEQICEMYGYESGVELELYLAQIMTWTRRFEEAQALISKAFTLLDKQEILFEYVLVWTVKAELLYAQGLIQEAMANWHYALMKERELGTLVDAVDIEKRLRQLGISVPSTETLLE